MSLDIKVVVKLGTRQPGEEPKAAHPAANFDQPIISGEELMIFLNS